jgi:hypothetical protein
VSTTTDTSGHTAPHAGLGETMNLPASQLDDDRDRDELRRRYYGLLQELRVLLPGVQVLVAFLLTAPFAQRFTELDSFGRDVFGASLVAGVVAIVAFVTPTAFHRLGGRTSRSQRLAWAVRMTRIGIVFMAISLECALFVIWRLVFGTATATIVGASVGGLMLLAWVALPLSVGRARRRSQLVVSPRDDG